MQHLQRLQAQSSQKPLTSSKPALLQVLEWNTCSSPSGAAHRFIGQFKSADSCASARIISKAWSLWAQDSRSASASSLQEEISLFHLLEEDRHTVSANKKSHDSLKSFWAPEESLSSQYRCLKSCCPTGKRILQIVDFQHIG